MVGQHLPDGAPMSRGLTSLRGYQRGGPIPLGGGLAALLGRRFGRGLSRLKPLFFGERSKTGYIPGVSEAVYNAVTPWASTTLDTDALTDLTDAMGRIARGDPGSPREEMHLKRGLAAPDEEDAWRIYLGLDQEGGTFKEAEFRPTVGSGEDVRYREFADPKRVWNEILSHPHMDFHEVEKTDLRREKDNPNAIQNLLKQLEEKISTATQGDPVTGRDYRASIDPRHRYSDVLGTYTVDKGEDERGPYISYYDKYDLKHIPARVARVGQPFDVYGRMYYDPETYEYRGSNE